MFRIKPLLAVVFVVASYSANLVNSVPILQHDLKTNSVVSKVLHEPVLYKRMLKDDLMESDDGKFVFHTFKLKNLQCTIVGLIDDWVVIEEGSDKTIVNNAEIVQNGPFINISDTINDPMIIVKEFALDGSKDDEMLVNSDIINGKRINELSLEDDVNKHVKLSEKEMHLRSELEEAINQRDDEKIKELCKKGMYRFEKSKDKIISSLSYASTKRDTDLLTQLLKEGAEMMEDESYHIDFFIFVRDSAKIEALFKAFKDVNFKIQDGKTALHFACEFKSVEAVKALIGLNADVNLVDKYGRTPLFGAFRYITTNSHSILNNRLTPEQFDAADKIANALVNANGFKVDVFDKDGYTPLHLAVLYDHANIVEALIKKDANVNAPDKSDQTPLHLAVLREHATIVKTLIKNGATVNKPDKSGQNPLHLAAFKSAETVMSFHGAKDLASALSARYKDETPLHLACQNGYFSNIKAFVGLGADVNAVGKHGQTPLHLVAPSSHLKVEDLLSSTEINVNLKDNSGKTPLHLALQSKYGHNIEALINDKRTDLNVADENGLPPLHFAIKNDLVDAAKLLIAQPRTDVNLAETSGLTPLYWAAKSGTEDMAISLIDHPGSNLELSDESGWTPLHLAAERGLQKLALALIKSGAIVDSRAKNQQTPLHRASRKCRQGMVKFLIEKKANVYSLDEDRLTPLHLASACDFEETVKVFAGLPGIKLDEAAGKGVTPLKIAIEKKKLNIIEVLVEIPGINLNVYGPSSGLTALHLAVESKKPELVKKLIRKGADVNLTLKNGVTPLQMAFNSKNMNMISALMTAPDINVNVQEPADDLTFLQFTVKSGDFEISRRLILLGADLNVRDRDGATLLHLAAKSENIEIMKFLIENGMSVHALDNFEQTPLHHFSKMSKNVQFLQFLVKSGANVKARDKFGHTPLHIAAGKSNADVKFVKALVDLGAEVNAKSIHGNTPLHSAVRGSEMVYTVQALVNSGANVHAKNNDEKTALDFVMNSSLIGRFLIAEMAK